MCIRDSCKGGHNGSPHLSGDGFDEQLLLSADAAADEDELRVEDVHQPRKALHDLVRPVLEKGEDDGVARMGRFEDGTAISPLMIARLRSTHEGRSGSIPLPAARCTAGAEDAIQRRCV